MKTCSGENWAVRDKSPVITGSPGLVKIIQEQQYWLLNWWVGKDYNPNFYYYVSYSYCPNKRYFFSPLPALEWSSAKKTCQNWEEHPEPGRRGSSARKFLSSIFLSLTESLYELGKATSFISSLALKLSWFYFSRVDKLQIQFKHLAFPPCFQITLIAVIAFD